MENHDLKKLSRADLIEIIYQLKKNERDLQMQIEALREELDEKRIKIETAGSVAQAALELSEVFQAAQRAADIYLGEIESRYGETKAQCSKLLSESKSKADEIIKEANEEKETLDIQCRKMRSELIMLKARMKSDKSDG